MTMLDEAMKTRLMKDMEEEIDRLIARTGDRATITLKEIEGVVKEAGRRIEQRLAEQVVAVAANEQEVERTECPVCGRKLRNKGKKARWVATTCGEVRLEREYGYCEVCGAGVFPPRSALGLD